MRPKTEAELRENLRVMVPLHRLLCRLEAEHGPAVRRLHRAGLSQAIQALCAIPPPPPPPPEINEHEECLRAAGWI